MSKKRRELLEVYYDVLKELRRNPMRITYLMRKCNIDTRMAKQIIGALISRAI
ncbi:MAG: hypothetical protein QXD50_00850 [Desulfurococcaceae archaeon]